ncbi:hypothetical protein PIROE2DRAFT_14695 [Piromyces sp. E2]|nr:hypothetical protein PIROE2DRAFT_14695 [Piromyces sp. E2]|eukprot:OUM59695.1 hypothetical protein PIROE2DRAFT_14695 [Piromyces sp. E2]
MKPKSPPPFSVNGKKYIQHEPVQFLSSHEKKEGTEKTTKECINNNDENINSKKDNKIKSQYVRMNFSNAIPEKINSGYNKRISKKSNNNLDSSNDDSPNKSDNKSNSGSKTNDKYYTLFDTNLGVKEAFERLSWNKIDSHKNTHIPSDKFKKIFHLDSDDETEKNPNNNDNIDKNYTTNSNEAKDGKTNLNVTTVNKNVDKKESDYTKLRNKEIYDNSIAIHASVVDADRKECIPINEKSKNAQYKSRTLSTRSLRSLSKSRSSKSLSSLASSNHLYDYKKLNDPNYLENLKFKYRHDPVGKKTLLELLRGTYVRNIGDDEDGLFFNKNNNHINYSRSRRSSVSSSRRSSVCDGQAKASGSRRSSVCDGQAKAPGSRRSSTSEPSNSKISNNRIPGVDKSPIEEQIGEFARKKGRFLSIEQMKEVVLEEKLKANKLGNGHKALASKAIMRKVNIVDDNNPSGNTRRNHFYKQLERMNDKYNASIYAMFNI